jgi:hypothetical protein
MTVFIYLYWQIGPTSGCELVHDKDIGGFTYPGCMEDGHSNYITSAIIRMTLNVLCFSPSQEVTPEEASCSDSTHVLDNIPPEKQYVAAECLGKSEGDCRAAFPDCPELPLDLNSQEFSMESIME